MNQSKEIRDMILVLIDKGFTDKSEIYDEILKQRPDLKRPIVRRACRELRLEIQKIYAILTKDVIPEVASSATN